MQFTLLLISILITLSSCKKAPVTDNNPAAINTPQSEVATKTPIINRITQNNLASKVKFKLENGEEAFSLKPKENGIKIEDADGSEIARLTVDEQRKIKIKNAADKTLGYVVSKDKYWKIENSAQTEELYILRQQADGDYKLETEGNRQIYRIKRRDYGWEIETPQKESLYKVKAKENKIVLRDKNEATVIKTKSDIPLLAVACFGFDILTQKQQSALAYAIALAGE
ncbi:MAG: hypothetical protein AAGE84_14695 [Cyanobacteria bacterium P01_G01_bin.39]